MLDGRTIYSLLLVLTQRDVLYQNELYRDRDNRYKSTMGEHNTCNNIPAAKETLRNLKLQTREPWINEKYNPNRTKKET